MADKIIPFDVASCDAGNMSLAIRVEDRPFADPGAVVCERLDQVIAMIDMLQEDMRAPDTGRGDPALWGTSLWGAQTLLEQAREFARVVDASERERRHAK